MKGYTINTIVKKVDLNLKKILWGKVKNIDLRLDEEDDKIIISDRIKIDFNFNDLKNLISDKSDIINYTEVLSIILEKNIENETNIILSLNNKEKEIKISAEITADNIEEKNNKEINIDNILLELVDVEVKSMGIYESDKFVEDK